METDQGTVKVESTPTNLKQRRPAGWVPYAGTKRKAHVANLGDHFDVDCRPSPAKQFAVDEDVASDILRGGYYYDPSIPTPPVNANQPPSNEVEMEEGSTTGTYIKGIGDPDPKKAKRRLHLAEVNNGSSLGDEHVNGTCAMEATNECGDLHSGIYAEGETLGKEDYLAPAKP